MKTGELSERLAVSSPTIRTWCEIYKDFLADRASDTARGATRVFSEHDSLVLATIARLRSQGLTHEQIKQALQQGKLIEAVPALSSPEEKQTRQSISLVPISELSRALDQVKVMQAEIERVIGERDKAFLNADDANQRIAQLSQELGHAKGVLRGAIAGIIGLSILLLAALIAITILIAQAFSAL